MKESREQEITNEQKQLQSKDVKMLNKKNQNIDQEKSQEKLKSNNRTSKRLKIFKNRWKIR